jgi:HSP20 family protein
MDEFFKGLGPLWGRFPMPRAGEGMDEFLPPADIIEREKEYLIKVDLPEIRREDVKVLFEGGVLTVKGERKVEKEEKGERMFRTERFYGTFERSFALPEDVDAEGIRAECKDGVLMLHLPKVEGEKARPRAIDVQ